MKPLTIEELKKLEIGDWVWIKKENYRGRYCQISNVTERYITTFFGIDCSTFYYSIGYGTNWIAYKNKEQAEAKGEIVILPKNKKKMFRVLYNPRYNDFNKEPENIIVPYTIIAESVDGIKYLVERNGWHGKKHQHWIKASEFMTRKQAEARLKELRGEK